MSEITIFKNSEFSQIRTIAINGKSWYVGKDITDILGYTDSDKAISDYVDNCDKLVNTSQIDSIQCGEILINESGLISLAFSCDLPAAKKLKHWITSVMLPTIRKTGGYVNNADSFVDNYLRHTDEQTKLLFKENLAAVNDNNKNKITRM